MKTIYGAVVAVAVLAIACGGGTTPGTDGGNPAVDGGTHDGGVADAGAKLDTQEHILSFLQGKTMTMTGANIPAYPNGYNANVYYGAATQCYKSAVITVNSNSEFVVNSELGSIKLDGGAAATTVGQLGHCDVASTTPYSPTKPGVVAISNVKNNGECFDITIAGDVTQEGRGSVTEDLLKLEVFFASQSSGANCAAGNPGTAGVLVNGSALAGDAVQKYVITH